jgi:hypothetical protein
VDVFDGNMNLLSLPGAFTDGSIPAGFAPFGIQNLGGFPELELRFCLPVGYLWGPSNTIELEPDLRVQNGIHLVFRKFQELGSARQVLLWCRRENITAPAIGYGEANQIYWKLPLYHTVLAILTNPIYAGAYAFGRTEARTKVVAGRAHRTAGHVN